MAQSVQKPKKVIITKALLWKHFKMFYKTTSGNEFLETEDSINNVAPIINYFAREEDFFSCKNLKYELGNYSLLPSFEKGLLIIGAYGNGKTTIMRTIGNMFNYFRMPMKFSMHNVHNLVTEFEAIGADAEFLESSKYQFFDRLTNCKGLYLDDVKKERIASNYGKVNLVREILEKRYDQKGLKTYITANYKEEDNVYDLEDAINELGEKYGGHIYDRVFSMFNIIEFKGKTFRK